MKIFIGSSAEAVHRGIVGDLAAWVEDCGHQVLRWDSPDAFRPGEHVLNRLLGISEAVEGAILVFAEDDTVQHRQDWVSQPRDNVLLEYGIFARALGAENVAIAREYAAKKPTDLDGIVYLDFSKEQAARNQLRKWLSAVEASTASQISELAFKGLSEKTQALFLATSKIVATITTEDHPLVRFLEAWYSQIAKELERGGPNTFEVDPSYYQACLTHLSKGREALYAIADLPIDVEGFWKTAQPNDVRVTERIFLLRQEDILNEDELFRLCAMLHKHASLYPVLVSHVTNRPMAVRPFSESPGSDIILVEPDLVGGYSQSKEKLRLRIHRNQHHHTRLLEAYLELKQRSVPVTRDMSPEDLRGEWIRINGIGIWQESWNYGRVVDRTHQYFENYDANIRTWVPFYDELIRRCARAVADNIEDRLQNDRLAPASILEIGFGTGALTLEALTQLERLGSNRIRYYGIDEAESRMRNAFDTRMTNLIRRQDFFWGKAYADKGWEPGALSWTGPFDIIAGSLVLHDIVSGSPRDKFSGFLDQCSGYLRNGGSVILADVFPNPENADKEEQRRLWHKKMVERGLDSIVAKNFLDNNSDMIDTVDTEMISALGADHGYSHETRRVGPEWSPFQILVMTKTGR